MSTTLTTGTIAAPGIKIGKAYICHSNEIIIPKYMLSEDEIDSELLRFENAIRKTKKDIQEIEAQIEKSLSKEMSDIFTSHLMVLEDPLVDEKVKKTIHKEKRNAEWVLNEISLEMIKSLSTIEDEYLRERIIDISDIHKRLIGNLQEINTTSISDINKEVIVFSKDLTPTDTALMNKDFILAFVTDHGGKTSHTAIMARALEIPAIVGAIDTTTHVQNGDTVIIDAIHGKIIIDPTDEEIEEFKVYEKEFRDLEVELAKLTNLPAQTLDSEDIFIYGNIEIPDEMNVIKNHGAQGIGLYRSEFLFMDRSLPDEERQFQEYKRVVDFFYPFPVTIRTIDVGGDKVYSYSKKYQERNPFLGCRAIRFSLENQDLFRIQLRAILRASNFGKVKLMFPLISSIEEFKKARGITETIMEDLKKEGIPFDEKIEIGLMIEVPSAVLNADILSKYADFFSVGTNDLVQYLLAVDRINEKIAYLYNPLNLAFLRFLKQVIDISNKYNVPTSICGEMAGEPQYTMILLGLGFRNFSMSPTYMYQVKKIIRAVTIKECENFVNSILQLEDTSEIEQQVRNLFKEKFHEISF